MAQEAEIKRIRAALKGNFLFQNLPATQTKQIYDVMRRKHVKAKEVVIQQGDKGEEFYVLDQGEVGSHAPHERDTHARDTRTRDTRARDTHARDTHARDTHTHATHARNTRT